MTVRYIDITESKTKALPVVEQYNVKGTPDFVLFGPDGEKIERGRGVWETIQERWGERG